MLRQNIRRGTSFQKLQECSQRGLGWSLLGLVIVTPYSAALANIFGALIIVLWLLGGTVAEDFKKVVSASFFKVLILLLIFVFASILWTSADLTTVFDSVKKFRKLVLLFIIWAFLSRADKWLERILVSAFVSFGIMAILCVGIYIGVPFLPNEIPGQGAILSRSHISQGYAMAILVVVSARYVFSRNNSGNILRLFAIALGSLAIIVTFFMTNGRTGYVCIFSALFFMLLAWQVTTKIKVVMMCCMILAFGGLMSSSSHVVTRMQEVGSDIKTYIDGDALTSSGRRISYWKTSLEMLVEHPFLGVGIGGWQNEYRQKTVSNPSDFKKIRVGHPHSDFLNVAAQFGIFGGACWLIFLLSSFRRSLRFNGKNRITACGFFGAYLAGALVNSFFWEVIEGYLFCITFAWILAAPLPQEQESQHPD